MAYPLRAPSAPGWCRRVVRARLRDVEQPDRATLLAELARVDRELTNVVDSLAKLGGSAALLARVRSLEADKAKITATLATGTKPIKLVPNVEKAIREKVRALEAIPRDALTDDVLIEKARAAVWDVIGTVTVREDGERVYAEVDFGRWYINQSAEERT